MSPQITNKEQFPVVLFERPRRSAFLACAASAVLAILLIFGLFHLWRADLTHPLAYPIMGDADGILAFFKTFMETGWYGVNCRLAAPGCQYHYDFPIINSAHAYAMVLLYWLLRNQFVVTTLYWFSNAVFTAAAATLVLQIFRVDRAAAIAGGVLYCFSEYWFFRGMGHFTLTMYGLCPFAILFSVALLNGTAPPFFRDDGIVRWKRIAAAAAICFLVGCCDVYYAFFFCLIIGVATVGAAARQPAWRVIAAGVTLLGATATAVFLNLVPNFIFNFRYGRNSSAFSRDFSNAEVWSMKLIRLLLPVHNHRIQYLNAIRQRYDRTAPLVNENDYVALGILGSIGLLTLFYWLLFTPGNRDALKARLAMLNAAVVLIGTVGGFGVVLAFFVSDQIRAYNRLFPFISFMSIAAIAMLATAAKKRLRERGLPDGFYYGAVCIIGLGALYDQTPRNVLPFDPNAVNLVDFYKQGSALWSQHAAFVASLDAALPRGAMVFELPFHYYPEAGPVVYMNDYDELRPYLMSSNIHWSAGAIRGRWEEAWQSQIAALPTNRMLQELALAGFAGVYVDRYAYTDAGKALEASFKAALGPGRESGDKRYAYYSLDRLRENLERQYTAAQWDQARERLLLMVFLQWQPAFLPVERNTSEFWRWAGGPIGRLLILNRLDRPRTLHLRFKAITGSAEPAPVVMKGPGIEEKLLFERQGTWIERKIVVPPGSSELRFSGAKPFRAPGDPRSLFFGLADFSVAEFAPAVTTSWTAAASPAKPDVTTGVLTLTNHESIPEKVDVSAMLTAARDHSPVEISGSDFQERLTLNDAGAPWRKTIMVSPGSNEIRFSCACGGTPNARQAALSIADLAVNSLDLSPALHELP